MVALLGPVSPWVVVAILLVIAAIIYVCLKAIHQTKTVASTVGGTPTLFPSLSISLPTSNGSCRIDRVSGRYSRVHLVLFAEIRPSLRGKARSLGQLAIPSFAMQREITIAGIYYRIAADDERTLDRLKQSFLALGETLVAHDIFRDKGIRPTLTVGPRCNFWMRRVPGSQIWLEPFEGDL